MIERIKQFSQMPIIRSIVILATGTAGAQAINIAFAPAITRLYGPEAFGLLGTFVAILTIIAPMAALTYPIAIVLPKSDSEAKGIIKLSILLALASSLLALALIIIWGDSLAEHFSIEPLREYLALIPLGMFFFALHQVMEQWLIRQQQFRITARVSVFQSALFNSAKAGLGLTSPTANTLIGLQTITSGMHGFLLWLSARTTTTPSITHAKKVNIKKIATTYRDFPFFRAPQILINSISQSLPVIVLAALSGPTAAGLYTLSFMVMGAPSNLIGKAVGDVLYRKMADTAHQKSVLSKIIIKPTAMLFLIGALPYGAIALFGPSIFQFVFGEAWITAGTYAQWLSIFFLFNFINKPSVAAVPILNIQKGLLIYEIFSTGIKIAGLLSGFYWFNSPIVGVALFSITGAIAYSALIFWIILEARRLDAKASRQVAL